MTLANQLRKLTDAVEALETASRSNGLRLVGATEVAALAGVSTNVVATWRRRGVLPAPAAELACGPIWQQNDIEAWLASRG